MGHALYICYIVKCRNSSNSGSIFSENKLPKLFTANLNDNIDTWFFFAMDLCFKVEDQTVNKLVVSPITLIFFNLFWSIYQY